MSAYELLDRQAGEDGHESFWERTMEHTQDAEGYCRGAALFGANLREVSRELGQETDWPETLVREAYMRLRIQEVLENGYAPEEIVIVTGAYHVPGLLSEDVPPMTPEELSSLPRVEASHTLMPYS